MNWGISPSRGVVIYNGFDLDRLKRIDGTALFSGVSGNDTREFKIVMTARMVKAKDFALFVSAARRVFQLGRTSWRFLAVGDGEDKANLINENIDLVRSGILEFPDAGLEVIPFLQVSRVGVLLTKPSVTEEGCSNSIMEYMACGLPVIATDSGGNKELVDDNYTGFIIPDGDLDTLMRKLDWLFENPSLAAEMGLRGRKKLEEQFSTKRMVTLMTDLYLSLLAQGRK
jgi:glycosyltransferase involved in cell wall biosynthesis